MGCYGVRDPLCAVGREGRLKFVLSASMADGQRPCSAAVWIMDEQKASQKDTLYHNKSHSAGSICMPHDTSPAGCSSDDQLSETQVLRSWGLRQDFLLDPHHGNCCTELAPDGLQLLLQSLILHMPHVSVRPAQLQLKVYTSSLPGNPLHESAVADPAGSGCCVRLQSSGTQNAGEWSLIAAGVCRLQP